MTIAPIPCAHCGTLFMRRDLTEEALRICNSCFDKEKARPKPKGKDMSKIKISIECEASTYAKVEEQCHTEGKSLSQYFIDLHELNIQDSWKVRKEADLPTLKKHNDKSKTKK